MGPDAVQAARQLCAERPAYALEQQLSRGQLVVNCQPDMPSSPPCVDEWFLDLPSGFELQNGSYSWRQYQQCSLRVHDRDWPVVDPHVRRAEGTKTVRDVYDLIGPTARVVVVGPSDAQQLYDQLHCAIRSSSARRDASGMEPQAAAAAARALRHFGWATYSADNGGCDPAWHKETLDGLLHGAYGANQTTQRLEGLRECSLRGAAFERMLGRADVVLVT